MKQPKYRRGFTLLEMMVALAILSGSLLWLIEATTRAIKSENHAKLVTTATFLARARMVQLEDELQIAGFTDDAFAKETRGDFDEKGFKRFHWAAVIDKIELPNTDDVQNLVSKGMESSSTLSGLAGGSSSSNNPGVTGSTGLLASQFGIIKDVLEQSIRRARVKVSWHEGRQEQALEIVQYLTDARRVDQTIQLGGLAGATPGVAGLPVPQAGGGRP